MFLKDLENWMILGDNSHKRRHLFHIVAEMLNAAKQEISKTQIMYKAKLSFGQLTYYLSFALELRLLERITSGDRTTYKTTEKGMEFIENYKEIALLLKKDAETASPHVFYANGRKYTQ